MRRRWYDFRRWLKRSCPRFFLIGTAILLIWGVFACGLPERCGLQAASGIMKAWIGVSQEESETERFVTYYLKNRKSPETGAAAFLDPAYRRMKKEKQEKETEEIRTAEIETETEQESGSGESAEASVSKRAAGAFPVMEKLADYDYLMKQFYAVHPTTTAGRDMMDAGIFLSMDLSIEKDGENPQILIYHTHSQEEYADYPENPGATIVGVGAYLKELLEAQGYRVIHDRSVYDKRDGRLDRSQAYTYALDGISGILQKYPSIEVVLDIHRDGVAEGTRLVTEIDGKPTARIMFFNGTSQTPDGPIEYLPNPNREANLAFSFQMQLLAAEKYPEFTRRIYLKGLRYNQHVRARSALIEVGAQTNTYAEALNAMEPLAELLCGVLDGG